jgi:hypothetical protein
VGGYVIRQYDPRTGQYRDLGARQGITAYTYTPPDKEDWAVVLRRAGARRA